MSLNSPSGHPVVGRGWKFAEHVGCGSRIAEHPVVGHGVRFAEHPVAWAI